MSRCPLNIRLRPLPAPGSVAMVWKRPGSDLLEVHLVPALAEVRREPACERRLFRLEARDADQIGRQVDEIAFVDLGEDPLGSDADVRCHQAGTGGRRIGNGTFG